MSVMARRTNAIMCNLLDATLGEHGDPVLVVLVLQVQPQLNGIAWPAQQGFESAVALFGIGVPHAHHRERHRRQVGDQR